MRPARAALTVAATALVPALLLAAPAFAADSPGAVTTGVTASATDGSTAPVDEMSDDDVRVAVLRILATAQENGDKAVVREATAALDDGSPEALRTFLETGYRLAQAEDDRVAVFRILAGPDTSDALRAAAEQALDDGSPEALRYFLEYGRYEVDA
ncbi:ALF repeat-containing protein [Streptomyces sp. NPDC048106]|uniref:ALF repeat-containing protein n=1 Tax=Streptomyces sp. NPDC048106 TaxID=3155750 RepID=UPI00345191E6